MVAATPSGTDSASQSTPAAVAPSSQRPIACSAAATKAVTRLAATTSSDLDGDDFPASNIMDGDHSTLVVTQSALNVAQYVSIQVPTGSAVSYVAVWNRGDMYASWINPYEVWLGSSAGDQGYQCGGEQTADMSLGAGPFLTCCGNLTTYSYVSIVLKPGTSRYLAIGELEIYSEYSM